jgi:HAD superfamily hydrolase (TIGR01549 family)
MVFHNFFWDFDGTLYNSYPRMESDLKKALEDEGIAYDQAVLRQQLKRALYKAILHFVNDDEDTAQKVMKRFRHYAGKDPIEGLHPFEGAQEALKAVKKAGGHNYLYTHRDNSALEALKRDGLSHLFSGFITSEDGYARKPAPDALLHASKLYNLKPEYSIMVGDRNIDAKAALDAGMAAALIFYEAADSQPLVPVYPSFSALISSCLRKAS